MPLAENVVRVIPPNGETAVVDILDTTGASVGTAYRSDSNGDTVSLPATITAQTDFHLPNQGAYDVSVKVNGTEIASASGGVYRVNLVGGPPELVAPRIDDAERSTGGSMPEPWTLDRAEYQSASLELNSGDKITWQIHGVDWGFTPLSLTDPQNPTIVRGGIYAISVFVPAYPAQPGKFGQVGLKLDDSNFGWHVFADAPLDGTDSPYGTGAMQASATVYLPAGAVVCTPVWHDVGAPAMFSGQMIVQLIQAETTPDPDYDL